MHYRVPLEVAVVALLILLILQLVFVRSFQIKRRASRKGLALNFANNLVKAVSDHLRTQNPNLCQRIRIERRVESVFQRGGKYWWGTNCVILKFFLSAPDNSDANDFDSIVSSINRVVEYKVEKLFKGDGSAPAARGFLVQTEFQQVQRRKEV